MKRTILVTRENRPPGRLVVLCTAGGRILQDESRGGRIDPAQKQTRRDKDAKHPKNK